ncbi:YggT family protein [bacterium]|nr:YggT family protein [bacterium]
MTDPVLNPIRRAVPDLGGLDISPMILIIGLYLLRNLF